MKTRLFLFALALFGLFSTANSTGLLILDASQNECVELTHDSVFVTVNDQVAIITARHTFFNSSEEEVWPKYAFPLNEGATATGLRWRVNNEWYQADFAEVPQDTILPNDGGGSTAQALLDFLGSNPLYFEFNEAIPALTEITVELEYVMLLPYELGVIEFSYPMDYSAIQNEPLDNFYFDFDLNSQRTIEDISCNNGTSTSWLANEGQVDADEQSFYPNEDLLLQYEVNNEELGLFSYSTLLGPGSQLPCDTLGPGFFGFVVEPPVSEDVDVINKVFTLVIDRSGSMSGQKIIQARDAASFIVDNMNYGDYFNIVDFSSEATKWASDHVAYSNSTASQAQNYINGIGASGGTNISGALGTAIPDFADADDEMAHIMIFFTDGQAGSGITETQPLVEYVDGLTEQHDEDLIIFTFGIGDFVNQQLLTGLALNNNGLFTQVANQDLYASISSFYLLIQNPVLLNTQIEFDPPIIEEIYPFPLQNLYVGQQLLLFGRYDDPQPVQVTLSGNAFGQELEYVYEMELSDSGIVQNSFLTKMWADQKIKSLQNQYYLSGEPDVQEDLQAQIIDLSLCYTVVSDFTSFSDNTEEDDYGTGTETLDLMEYSEAKSENDMVAFPNPFHDEINVDLSAFGTEPVTLRIINLMGEVIAEFRLDYHWGKIYTWKLAEYERLLKPGMYIIEISSQNLVVSQHLMNN